MREAFKTETTLGEMGLGLVSLGISGLAPTSELARALQTPTFESLQQQADEATFARRALAVEKERAIAENELANKIELTAREKELIALEDANTRSQAEAQAAAERIRSEAEADRIRSVDGARGQMEKERLAIYSELAPETLMAMAAKEFAGKLEHIDNISVTPDMLAGVVSQLRGTGRSAEPAETDGMSSLNPRVVVVTRQTELEELLAKHATRGQAEFFLSKRGQSLDVLSQRHQHQKSAVHSAKSQCLTTGPLLMSVVRISTGSCFPITTSLWP